MINYPKVKLVTSDKDVEEINKKDLVDIADGFISVDDAIDDICSIRTNGSFKGHAMYLDSKYDYRIVKDEQDALCLLILHKPKSKK